MSDLKAYLASKYMSGPKADAIIARSGDPTIKKKKKKISKNEDYVTKLESGQGLMMRDEDEWKHGDGEDVDMNGDEDAPLVGKELATFNKSKSTWSTVGSTSLPMASQPSAAGPSSRSQEPEEAEQDTKPDIDHATGVKKVVTKRKGGLKTAAQIREDFEAVQAEKARALAEAEAAAEAQARENGEAGPSTSSAVAVNPHQGQTIHRDSSGRIVDVEKLKREAKAQEDEEKRKAREREEWSKGLVQRQKQQDRAREEAEMGSKDVARYANDAKMNKELAEVSRWNDPAADFLTKKKKSKGPRRPKYEKAYAPNRFGIPPGFRWDGVDRSNGFEKKYFQHQNTVARRNYAADQMGMEDM